jgi:hypothetical protein
MKEFEYVDILGKESVNTQDQLDTFEAVQLFGGKDRFIFDFSTPLFLYPPITSSNPNDGYLYTQLWNNHAVWDKKWDTRLGVPGDAQLFYKDFLNIGNSPKYPNYTTVPTPLNEDINEKWDALYNHTINKGAPYFNENAAIFVGSKFAGIYGNSSSATNPDAVTTIRSGYYEFTIKTDKNNCIIASGSHSQDYTFPSAIDNKTITINEGGSSKTFKILIEDGKLKIEYEDLTGNNKIKFDVKGNKTVSDNQWHHIVVNLGKPGVKRNHSKKHNEKFIEFWIDGILDKRNSDYSNNQIFYPTITWLLVDPKKSLDIPDTPWLTQDYDDQSASGNSFAGSEVESVLGFTASQSIIYGNNELGFFSSIQQGWWRGGDTSNNFRGAINTYAAGYNQCLDKFEIQFRNSLWRGNEKPSVDIFDAKITIVEPTIHTNKKKALKLFWNKLNNQELSNGVELDKNYYVESYSITHKVINSPTEIYNIDLSNNKKIQFLEDVRVIVKDNMFIPRPGAVWVQNFEDVASNVGTLYQSDMYDNAALNALRFSRLSFQTLDYTQTTIPQLSGATLQNITISGINLNNGDRILLTNQYNPKDNGIYVFNGMDNPLTRPSNSDSAEKLANSVVYVTDGYYKGTSWIQTNNIKTLLEKQTWIELDEYPKTNTIGAIPIFSQRWQNENGEKRFIDLEQDLNISKYDLIIFMNYPETNEEIKQSFTGYDDFEIKVKYDNFIKSLRNVCAQGASLYVSSPKLAQDLGIIKTYKLIDQMLETSDAQSAVISPFEAGEPADQYFDTHRINQYQLQTEVAGLTNKETYILTDFINYVPSNINEPQQYHAKYAYRQLGLKEGNQFFIPSLSLLKIAENEKLPGFAANRKGTKQLPVVEPNQINAGTIVTKLQNTYYQNGQIVNNPSDDDATTIIVHNGQVLNGQPITGKIFVNFIEDGYTMSRQEYNKARIQVIPQNDTNETTATRAWQYSTTRLNRLPQRINIRELTEYGQTTPTNGGGGPLIQAPTNSSNGIIRSLTDAGNVDYQSDLYPTEAEEIYPTQEIPVLSMTYLGLLWLAE